LMWQFINPSGLATETHTQTVSTAIPVTVIATNSYSCLKLKPSIPVTVNLIC
jgi:hypothetical protein